MSFRMQTTARLTLAAAFCLYGSATFAQELPTAANELRISWVNPPPKAPTGVQHGTFHSACKDLAHWRETSTWHLLKLNRDRIAGRLPIRIIIGTEDFSLEGAKTTRDRLADLKIAFEFKLVQGPDHNIYKLYDHAGLEAFQLHAMHFCDAASKSRKDNPKKQ